MKQKEVEKLRLQYESVLMNIKGVTAIGTSLCNEETTCLKIYTCIPTDQILPLLPEELKKYPIELEFVGDIKTQ